MPRPSAGTVAQALSETALAAHVASRLVGRLSDRVVRDDWLERELGMKLRSNGVERAARRAQAATSPSVLVDERRLPLGLEKACVRFPGRSRPRPRLVARLRALGVVRQLIVTRHRRDLVCVLVYRSAERDAVRAQLEALGQPLVWEEIAEEDRELERAVWIAMARRLAAAEGLLAAAPPGGRRSY